MTVSHVFRSWRNVATLGVGIIVSVMSLTTLALEPAGALSRHVVAHDSGNTCSGNLPTGTVVGLAATNDDGGYWIANNQGLVVGCGDAPNFGQLSSTPNRPIVGIVATADGGGYFLVATDGGVFAFGDAVFQGSTGAITLNKPVVGMTIDPATGGYWLVASDGGIFSFNAPFFGSTGAIALNKPIVGMESNATDSGYRFVATDGGIFDFGTSSYFGSAVAPLPPPTPPVVPVGPASCSVSMSNPSPPAKGDETANITSSVPSTAVSVTAHYRTTTSSFGGVTDGSGNAAVTFSIGSPTVGYTVGVNVSVGAASCSTSFTPT
jgi:hypothetical protein